MSKRHGNVKPSVDGMGSKQIPESAWIIDMYVSLNIPWMTPGMYVVLHHLATVSPMVWC